MKSNSHKQFEAFARKVIAEYQKKLLIERHEVDLEAKDGVNYMECQFRVLYLDTVIRYNPELVARDWREKKFKDLRHGLIHELCHIVTDPFYAFANDRYAHKENLHDERERLTDHIAMIVEKNGV